MSIFPIASQPTSVVPPNDQGGPPAVGLGNDFDPFMKALLAMPTLNLKTDKAASVAPSSDQGSPPAVGAGNDFTPFINALLTMPTLNLKADSAGTTNRVASVATASDQGGSPASGMGKDFDAAMASFLAIPHFDSQMDTASVASFSDGAPAGAVVEHLASAAPSIVASTLDVQSFTAAVREATKITLTSADKLDVGSALDIKT